MSGGNRIAPLMPTLTRLRAMLSKLKTLYQKLPEGLAWYLGRDTWATLRLELQVPELWIYVEPGGMIRLMGLPVYLVDAKEHAALGWCP